MAAHDTFRRRLRRAAATATVGLWALAARGAGPLGADGAPIRTSSYGVDLTQTPVLSSARITGLAGAYVAIAEGLDGDLQTPVAPAVRTTFSVDHFDYELALGLTLPATLTSTDFFNTGRDRTQLSDARQQGFVFITPAINLAWGGFGIGATAELSSYSLRRSSDAPQNARLDQLSAQFLVGHLQAAQAFDRGQLVLGAGLRILALDVNNPGAPSGERDLFTTSGAGIELGALWMPTGLPFRVGAAFRSAVSTNPDAKSRIAADAAGDRIIGDPTDAVNAFWLPSRVDEPWDLDIGAAFQLGPRPLNPGWLDPSELRAADEERIDRRLEDLRRERDAAGRKLGPAAGDAAAVAALAAELDTERVLEEQSRDRIRRATRERLKRRHARLPRRYLLISTSLVVTGPVRDAVGVESFLQRVVARSGRDLVYSPRLGVETEPIPSWLKVRAGTYAEPTRFATSRNRLHGTMGFDAKLLAWTVFGLFDDDTEWRVSTSLDAARRYLGWGLSAGVWH